jgi:hypothetical protein
MVYNQHRLAIPSNRQYSTPQLQMMIHEIEVIMVRRLSAREWENLPE